MRFLLDSHLLVWLIGASHKLPSEVRVLAQDPAKEMFFSAASILELAIKYASGKIDLELPPQKLADELIVVGFHELAVTSAHAVQIENLPAIHKDPFDRILVAQAMMENMTLLTSDDTLGLYGEPVRVVR